MVVRFDPIVVGELLETVAREHFLNVPSLSCSMPDENDTLICSLGCHGLFEDADELLAGDKDIPRLLGVAVGHVEHNRTCKHTKYGQQYVEAKKKSTNLP